MTRTSRRSGLAACLLALALAGPGSGCAREPNAGEWLEQMNSAHRSADEALDRGDAEAAREVLQAQLYRPAPEGMNPQDLRVVRQDVYHRLAEIELLESRFSDARVWADHGLGLGRGGDVFEANLLVARGRAQEQLGLDGEAADDFYEALRINERLLRQQLAPEGSQ